MPPLKLMQDELKAVVEQQAALRREYPDGYDGAARVKVADLRDRGLKLQQLIAQEQDAESDQQFKNLQAFLSDPRYVLPRGLDDDPISDKKRLEKAGWNFDGGVFGPTSTGKPYKLFDNDSVLWGPLPTGNPEETKFVTQTRAMFNPVYGRAYLKWLRSPFRNDGMAFAALDGEEQKALSEGTDSAGGYLVPPDLQTEILARSAQQSIFLRLARVITTSRDRIVFPRLRENTTSGLGSIYSSMFVGSMVGETPTFSDTDPLWGTFEVSIKKARVATRISNDLLSDSASNILSFLSMNGAENMALLIDNELLTGDGTALHPLGLLNDSGLTTVDVEGSTADTISNTTSNAGSAPKIIDLTYALPSQYANNSQFLMRRAIEGKVRKLIDASGRFLWPPMIASGFAAVTRELMGYPVNNSEFMPNDGTNANKVILYGDFSAYIVAMRQQISTVVLRERFADTDQTGIILFARFGGGLSNADAFRVGIV